MMTESASIPNLDNEETIEINPEKISLLPDSRLIYQPRFIDNQKSKIRAIVKFPDGTLREIEADRNDTHSPFIRDVFLQYSEAEIELFSHREQCVNLKLEEIAKREREDREHAEKMANLFKAKSEALQIEEVKNSGKDLARRIRSAKSVTEVLALTTLALLERTQRQ